MPRRPYFRGLQLPFNQRLGWISDADRIKRAREGPSAMPLAKMARLAKAAGAVPYMRGNGRHNHDDFAIPANFTAGNIETTFYQTTLTGVSAAAGSEKGRNTNDLKFKKFNLRAVLQWGDSKRMRLVVARIKAQTTPLSALGIDALELYGRRLPDIKHVYYDKVLYNDGSKTAIDISMIVDLMYTPVHYQTTGGDTQDRDDIVLLTCGDKDDSTTYASGRASVSWVEA